MSQRAAVRGIAFNKRGQVGAHRCYVAHEPARKIDHVRAQVAENTAGSVAIETPGIFAATAIGAQLFERAVIAQTYRPVLDQYRERYDHSGYLEYVPKDKRDAFRVFNENARWTHYW